MLIMLRSKQALGIRQSLGCEFSMCQRVMSKSFTTSRPGHAAGINADIDAVQTVG